MTEKSELWSEIGVYSSKEMDLLIVHIINSEAAVEKLLGQSDKPQLNEEHAENI